jgi:meso-butanediol dehydrogenase / (S,S)-butanediol dehydrogenase / diacetyl reductase
VLQPDVRQVWGHEPSSVTDRPGSRNPEGGRHHIRANTICPGLIHTPATDPVISDPPIFFQRMVLDRIPLGRVGRPEDVARLALFLASDESEWITGAHIVVDGGLTALG